MTTHTTPTPLAGRRRRFTVPVGINLDEPSHDALTAEAEAVGLAPAALARVLVLDGLRARQSRSITEAIPEKIQAVA